VNEIAVAVIGMATALIVALIETTRRQNNRDHAINADKLDSVIEKIDKVDDRLGGHIDWHLKKD
jgi:cellobiose-specific phosphotransferase system component IIB